jgi:hypothetical protein
LSSSSSSSRIEWNTGGVNKGVNFAGSTTQTTIGTWDETVIFPTLQNTFRTLNPLCEIVDPILQHHEATGGQQQLAKVCHQQQQ